MGSEQLGSNTTCQNSQKNDNSNSIDSRASTRDRREYFKKYQSAWMKKRRETWLAANGPCRLCGSSERLEVDHIDHSTKVDHRVWSWSDERRKAELAKCQVLCHDCHKRKTAEHSRLKNLGKPGRPLKLTEEVVLEIYALVKAGVGPREIGRKFEISHSTVIKIRDGENWAWLTRKQAQLDLLPRSA